MNWFRSIWALMSRHLASRISEYNKMQLERDNNLKTTTENNPLIQAYDASLEKIRQDMSEALNNVKNGYEIARNKMLQQKIRNV